jgi:hypothetical protein
LAPPAAIAAGGFKIGQQIINGVILILELDYRLRGGGGLGGLGGG